MYIQVSPSRYWCQYGSIDSIKFELTLSDRPRGTSEVIHMRISIRHMDILNWNLTKMTNLL